MRFQLLLQGMSVTTEILLQRYGGPADRPARFFEILNRSLICDTLMAATGSTRPASGASVAELLFGMTHYRFIRRSSTVIPVPLAQAQRLPT